MLLQSPCSVVAAQLSRKAVYTYTALSDTGRGVPFSYDNFWDWKEKVTGKHEKNRKKQIKNWQKDPKILTFFLFIYLKKNDDERA